MPLYGGRGGNTTLEKLIKHEFKANSADLKNGDNASVCLDKIATFIGLTKEFMNLVDLSYKGVFNSLADIVGTIPSPNLGDYAFSRAEPTIYICGTLGHWNLNLNQGLINQVNQLISGAAATSNTLSSLQALVTANQANIALKQNITDNTLQTTNKTIVGAINENTTSIGTLNTNTTTSLALKQNITDNTLQTTNKTIVGAINENKTSIDTLNTATTTLSSAKQNITDNTLQTTNKTIVGAINEVLSRGGGSSGNVSANNFFYTINFTSLISTTNEYQISFSTLPKGNNYFKVSGHNLLSILYIPSYDQAFENTKIIIQNRGIENLSIDIDGNQYEILPAAAGMDFVETICHYLNGEIILL